MHRIWQRNGLHPVSDSSANSRQLSAPAPNRPGLHQTRWCIVGSLFWGAVWDGKKGQVCKGGP